jgi:AcrR family transcriptional regulator
VADRPLRADARRNRERVLVAARDVFAESGFAVPLDEIAARAGVGPGTVYRHFPTKEALFEAVALARVEDLASAAREGAEADDAGAAFDGFLARLADEAVLKADLPDALAGSGSDAVAAAVRDMHHALDRLLRRAQEAGAVRPDVRVGDVIALLKGLLHSLRGGADPGLAGRVLAVVTDGLRRSPDPAVHRSTDSPPAAGR